LSLVIGLTGSIATGKSTVAEMFKELSIPVIDADLLAREVVEPGEEAYTNIIEHFGDTILQADRTLDRKRLGEIVFSDEEKRKDLNGIIHPAIRKRMLEQRDALIKKGEACIVLDIPLLFESELEHFVDKTLVVYLNEKTQLERLMKRNELSKEEALQRISSQIPVKEKAQRANEVIDNNGTKEETFMQLKEVLTDWGVSLQSS
jgi:dephospho-CoA kinase